MSAATGTIASCRSRRPRRAEPGARYRVRGPGLLRRQAAPRNDGLGVTGTVRMRRTTRA
jgi:hypothetical protein